MTERIDTELELLRSVYPNLEHQLLEGNHWVRLPDVSLPEGWSEERVDVAFRIPASIGEAPYAFAVMPPLLLEDGRVPDNYTAPVATPWDGEWGQFSWAPESWVPHADIRGGPNMLTFVRSFHDRLNERS